MSWIRNTNGPGCAARRWCRSATKYGAMNEQASAGRAGYLSEPEHHWHVPKRCLKASPYPSLTSGRQFVSARPERRQTRPSGARLVSRAEPRGLQTVHATRSRELWCDRVQDVSASEWEASCPLSWGRDCRNEGGDAEVKQIGAGRTVSGPGRAGLRAWTLARTGR